MNASSLILRRRYAATALITLVVAVIALSSLSAWRTGQHARHLNALIQSGLVTALCCCTAILKILTIKPPWLLSFTQPTLHKLT